MKMLKLASGDLMPALGLGTWKSDHGQVYNAVREAIRQGYRHIDCAAIYENEAEIGQALSDAMEAGEVRREELWITSKLWNNAHAPVDVEQALKETLSDLCLDYLDLYLIHWPVAWKNEVAFPASLKDLYSPEDMPVAVTWKAMEECVDKGLCRNIGVSNFNIAKLENLTGQCRIKPSVNQIELHPFLPQPEMLAYCQEQGIVLTAYSPLGSRDRSEQMKASGEPSLFEAEQVLAVAQRHGITPAQVLLAWAVNRGTSVIPKSVHPDRLKQNLESAKIELTEGDMEQLSAIDQHYRYVHGHFWDIEGSPYTVEYLWGGQ